MFTKTALLFLLLVPVVSGTCKRRVWIRGLASVLPASLQWPLQFREPLQTHSLNTQNPAGTNLPVGGPCWMMTSALWGRLHRKARALVMIQVCLGLEHVEGRQGDQLVDSRGLPAQLPLCCHSCQSEGVPGTVSLCRAPGSSTQSARTRPDYYIYVPWHQTESILTMASSGDCTYPGIGGLAALAHGVHMPIEGASRRPHGHPASDQALIPEKRPGGGGLLG